MKSLYMIGGAMGVGKTSVCRALQRDLPQNVFLDGDWCWDAVPFQVTEETKAMVVENICDLLRRFLQCSAYQNILFCWVMHEQRVIDLILDRLPPRGCAVKCISLTADESTLRGRLEKDVAAGLRSEDVIARSLARLPLYSKLNTIKVDTTGKTVQSIADEIRRM